MEQTRSRRFSLLWIALAVVLVLIVYFGSAYFCFWRFTTALQERNRDRLAFYVDFRGVRESLKTQWHNRMAGNGGTASRAERIASMINAVAPNLIDQAIDLLVTPDGLVSLLEHPQAARDPATLVTHGGGGGTRIDLSNLRHAWFSGLRDFVVEHEGVKLHFRFTKWRWRLLDVDLGLTNASR